ncbi:MAG: helix-turn-helix domain-containing protein [Planctomycetaceae bacterium]|nr:helix-turn-helix domain-containing protein [Planctomycetaceae bacterium]
MTAMLMFSSEDVALLLANNVERQWILTRLAGLDQQDKKILSKAEDTKPVDVSMFSDETRRLLMEFLKAPKCILSRKNIRQDVMLLLPEENDIDANGSALRQIIGRARKNMKEHPGFPYEIKNIRGKGYQLVSKAVLRNAAGFCEKQDKNVDQ